MTHADRRHLSRRRALRSLAGFLAASPLVQAQREIVYTPDRMPTLDDIVNVFEMEPVCRLRLPKQNYDFIAGGVDNEWTMKRNRDAFDRFTIHPRMLVNTMKMDLSTTLFGTKIGMPVLVAPTAGHQLAHPDGEEATAKAAAASKTIMCVSSVASLPFEKIAQATDAPKWWQLYPREDDESTEARVRAAVAAGYKAVILTVDAPYNSHRERLLRNREAGQVPGQGAATTTSAPRRRRGAAETAHPYRLQPALVAAWDWTYVKRVKDWAKVPVLVKGLLTAEDAGLAKEHGADGIVVSNHGGRYLDYAPSTIEVLPEILKEVNGRMPVLIDSGFRRGTDILKALALGANAVLVGRPPLWGLGAFGQAGVEKVLQMLESELALAMGLAGQTTIQGLRPSLVRLH
ncbi:MAG: alpha-hydroxy-acid oxidizing protein [Bryobacterales bacterium]|nr:alpha-hydroxy-acid oxidizing protein [Bryobacterales bacterium]